MSHEITVEFKGDHIHARHTGTASYEISLAFWHSIAQACEEHHCYNILGESDHANGVAWVNHNPSHGWIFDIIESVMKERFVANGHVFKTVVEAKKWLLAAAETPVE
jgi:hypothetical protein